MITLTLSDESRQTIQQFLARLDQIETPTPDDIAPIQAAIRAGFAESFASESGANAPWAYLQPRTQQERERLGFPPAHPILIRTGIYRESFISPGGDHISEWTAGGGKWEITEGSTDYRGDELEYGRADMFPRPVTDLNTASEDQIAQVVESIFDRWFEEAA